MLGNEISKLFVTIGANTAEFDKGLKNMESSIRKVGAVMTSVGTGILAFMGASTKMAADEQAGIEQLRVAMDNVGLTYDGATGSLEGWIDKQQQSTAFSDTEQREALSSLIILTKDMTKAQELLSIAMDVSRWKNMDLQTASELLMKVYAGDMGLLKRYGIIVDENATSTEALAQIQQMAAGQAETYGKTAAGQMALLKNNIGDVMEGIGGALLPMLTDMFKAIQPILQSIKEWITLHPGLTKVIVVGVTALGLLMVGLGMFLLIAPGIAAAGAMMGAGFMAALGPIGLIIAAIAAAIAIGVLIATHWEEIAGFFKDVWGRIKNIFQEHWDKILAILFPAVGLPILIARHWEEIVTVVKNIFIRVVNAIKEPIEDAVNWFIDKINWLIEQLNKIPGVSIGALNRWATPLAEEMLGQTIQYQHGGIIPEPTLLYGLRSRRTYGIAGEAGTEFITPGSSGGGVVITGNNFYIREEADIDKVGMELERRIRLRARYV
jgi:hypothetical protein